MPPQDYPAMRRVDSSGLDGAVRLRMSEAERATLLNLLMIDPELESVLSRAPVSHSMLEVELTFNDLQNLAGYVAFDALHTTDRELEKRLNRLFDQVEAAMQHLQPRRSFG